MTQLDRVRRQVKEQEAVAAEDYDLAKKLKKQREELMKRRPDPVKQAVDRELKKREELSEEEKRAKRVAPCQPVVPSGVLAVLAVNVAHCGH